MGRSVVFAMLVLAACSDYELSSTPKPGDPPVDTDVPEPSSSTTTTPPPPVVDTVDTAIPEPTCDGVTFEGWQWVGSPTFADAVDPVDASGRSFWDPGADVSAWDPVTLPDRAIPIGQDRAYVGTFELTEIPLNLSLSLQSDDGISVWVNGAFVGQWGGSWQAEGCVNENAQCLVTIQVPPVDVTSLLQLGTNVVAARVSNPVQNAYFEIIPECVD